MTVEERLTAAKALLARAYILSDVRLDASWHDEYKAFLRAEATAGRAAARKESKP